MIDLTLFRPHADPMAVPPEMPRCKGHCGDYECAIMALVFLERENAELKRRMSEKPQEPSVPESGYYWVDLAGCPGKPQICEWDADNRVWYQMGTPAASPDEEFLQPEGVHEILDGPIGFPGA